MSENTAALTAPSDDDGFLAAYGFVPNLFRAQSRLPLAVAAEQNLIHAAVIRDCRLTRGQKESILFSVADARGNDYCRALFGSATQDKPPHDSAVRKFVVKLALHAPWFSRHDVATLRAVGFHDEAVLEIVATTAVGQMLCTLADGLRPAPDRSLDHRTSGPIAAAGPFDWSEDREGPYLGSQAHSVDKLHPYNFFTKEYGFVPNLYRVQSARLDLVEAEIQALTQILLPEDFLSRIQKEYIVLAVSAANLNTYYVAMRGQILSALGGVPLDESDQIVDDHDQSSLSVADKALLEQTRILAAIRSSGNQFEPDRLREHGFSEAQIVEAVVVSALVNFLNTLQAGVGAGPDFPPRRDFGRKDLYPFPGKARPIFDVKPLEDPDSDLVGRVQGGDIDVFEELVRRHSRRVFGALAGILGNLDDARDATQEVFLKAFEHIGTFQGRSKFSTWLTSIAINTGTELLRQRKPVETLDQEDEEDFRPRQIQSWTDNPEEFVVAAQRDKLVREGILRLPQKYRVAVLLRDISQLSTEEAAAALQLSIPALKARLLRGRLMLRETLSPYFMRMENRSPDA